MLIFFFSKLKDRNRQLLSSFKLKNNNLSLSFSTLSVKKKTGN